MTEHWLHRYEMCGPTSRIDMQKRTHTHIPTPESSCNVHVLLGLGGQTPSRKRYAELSLAQTHPHKKYTNTRRLSSRTSTTQKVCYFKLLYPQAHFLTNIHKRTLPHSCTHIFTGSPGLLTHAYTHTHQHAAANWPVHLSCFWTQESS